MGRPSGHAANDPDPRPIGFCTAPTGTRIAYAAAGRGPALLVPPAWISHLELLWQDPAFRAFVTPLAGARRVVQYDRPNCGLSEPWQGPQGLDTDVAAIRAVADHLELERFDLLGISLGAPVSVAFAARFPERVDRLILYGGYADGEGAERLDLPDASVDAVISSLVLCTVPDPRRVLAEVYRVLRPGGRYVFFEHVAAADGTTLRRIQRAVRRPWTWFFEGCSCERDLQTVIEESGFDEITFENYRLRSPFLPANTQIAGVAVK